MAGALPILLLGGAALMMMGGAKKTTTTGAPKKKGAPSYGKDSSSMISIYQDGSVRLGKGWESAHMDPFLERMWKVDFKDAVDVDWQSFVWRDGWGFKAEDFFLNPMKKRKVFTYDPGSLDYRLALSRLLDSITVNYYGQSKKLSEFTDAYPHVKSLRNDIRWMFEKWTKSKIRRVCASWGSCETEGL